MRPFESGREGVMTTLPHEKILRPKERIQCFFKPLGDDGLPNVGAKKIQALLENGIIKHCGRDQRQLERQTKYLERILQGDPPIPDDHVCFHAYEIGKEITVAELLEQCSPSLRELVQLKN